MNYQQLEEQLKLANEEANNGNFDSAEHLANQVLAELHKQNQSLEVIASVEPIRANATLSLATTNYKRGNFDTALEQVHRVLVLADEGNLLEIKPKAWSLSGIVYRNLGDYTKALEYLGRALDAHELLGQKSEVAAVAGSIGSVYTSLGNYDKALEYYGSALDTHEFLGMKSDIAKVTGNIGLVHLYLDNYSKALECLVKALDAHEFLGQKSLVASVTGNIGSVYFSLGNCDKALEYMQKALNAHELLGQKAEVAVFNGNIGIVYDSLGNYDKALEYYRSALHTHELIGQMAGVARVTGNIGVLYATNTFKGYDPTNAEKFLLKAIAMSSEIGAKALLVEQHSSIADLYKYEKKWEEYATHLEKYIEIKDEVNIEETKKQDSIREHRKVIELAKAKADAKHQATEQLLHNVLPPSIANKMLDGTKLIAEKIPSVSVLFADIVNFTKLSQRITPEELVEGLDRIFSEFDALAEKYGLEKIKTIGDAYMVISGAPVQRIDHAEVMAHFALEMVESMKHFHSISTGEEIQLRIGIHSGEVVAGVIGKKKFAYDMWGDAVNTASRMESHGEPGKIHVSEEFLKKLLMERNQWLMDNGEWLIEEANDLSSFTINNLPLTIIPRGELEIKGKGKMNTYFLEAM